jgi:hypothetical protein
MEDGTFMKDKRLLQDDFNNSSYFFKNVRKSRLSKIEEINIKQRDT